MNKQPRWLRPLVILAIAAMGILPLCWYWFFIGRLHTIPAHEAKARLSQKSENSILVDVREAKEFQSEYVKAAVNWPLSEIVSLKSASDIPQLFKGKTLYLICNAGMRSSKAAARLLKLGFKDFYNIRGGMQEWKNSTIGPPCPLQLCQLQRDKGSSYDLPFRPAPLSEQWALSLTAFALKPSYMLLSLILIIVLWRSRTPDLAAFRWGMIFFLAGESFCAANFLFFQNTGYMAEYLHSYSMVMAFAFTTWAAAEALDQRVIKYSDPEKRCAGLELCGSCIKYIDVPCKLRRTFLLVLPMLMIMAILPMMAKPAANSYNTMIFATPYNYAHEVIFQIYEIKLSPLMAEAFFAASFLVLGLKKTDTLPWAKALFAAGAGWMGFAYFRLIFYQIFRDNPAWFSNWEEITEFLYISGAALILWIFRRQFFQNQAKPDAPEPA